MNDIKVKNPSYDFANINKEANEKRKTLREIIFENELFAAKSQGGDDYVEMTKMAMVSFANTVKTGVTDFKNSAGFGFAFNGFTVLDAVLRMPISNAYATQFVPTLTGGGALELSKGFYRSASTRRGTLGSGQNNRLALTASKIASLEVPIIPLQYRLFVGQINLMKFREVGFDIIGANAEDIRVSYNVDLDILRFVGLRKAVNDDTTNTARGVLNRADVTPLDLATQTTYTLTGTQNQLGDMNTVDLGTVVTGTVMEQAASVAFDVDYLINSIVVSPANMRKLTAPASITGTNGTVFRSKREYLQAQLDDITESMGADRIMIRLLPYLDTVSAVSKSFDPMLAVPGTNGYGRTWLYRQDPYVLYARSALPLVGAALIWDATNNGVSRNYIAFESTPLSFYDTIRYIDDGATGSTTL